MDKQEIRAAIASLIEQQEAAIHNHPPNLATAYIEGRDLCLEAFVDFWAKEELPHHLTDDDLLLITRYQLSSSFVSAWYHLVGNKARRDQAAHSCTILVTGLGLDSEVAFTGYVRLEQMWRRSLTEKGLVPQYGRGIACLAVIVIIISVVVYWFFFR